MPTQAPTAPRNAPPPPRPYPFPVGVFPSELIDYDQTVVPAATIAAWTAPVQCPMWNVSPTGWLRGFWLDYNLTITGGGTTATYTADGPFSGLQKVIVYDLGSQQVFSLLGYELLVMNKFGGYFEVGDPRADITYSAANTGNVHFLIYVPFEVVRRDSLGVVQNESKPGWKVEIWLDSAQNTYGTGATLPTGTGTISVRLRGMPDAYTEPAAAAPNGRPFSQTPPLPGTLQTWSSENTQGSVTEIKYDLVNGIGFPIRNIIYYVRDAGNQTRATADPNWPDPATLLFGNVNYFTRTRNKWLSKMSKEFAYANLGATSPAADSAQGRENGVFPVWMTADFDSHPGDEARFAYLDTQVNTLVRLTGAAGGSVILYALVNYIKTPSKNRYALIAGS